MITYSTNWMGPISMNWYRERGLTHMEEKVCDSELVMNMLRRNLYPSIELGDTYQLETITTHYSAGRIDIRDDSKWGYDGNHEYAIPPMHSEDWNKLQEWLDTVKSEELIPYDTLIQSFEEHYGKRIRWME